MNGLEEIRNPVSCTFNKTTGVKKYEYTETQFNAIEKELKALESAKELFDFDFAIRFPTNQPMLRIMNKRTNEYWEIPIPKEKHDLLKEVLL